MGSVGSTYPHCKLFFYFRCTELSACSRLLTLRHIACMSARDLSNTLLLSLNTVTAKVSYSRALKRFVSIPQQNLQPPPRILLCPVGSSGLAYNTNSFSMDKYVEVKINPDYASLLFDFVKSDSECIVVNFDMKYSHSESGIKSEL